MPVEWDIFAWAGWWAKRRKGNQIGERGELGFGEDLDRIDNPKVGRS